MCSDAFQHDNCGFGLILILGEQMQPSREPNRSLRCLCLISGVSRFDILAEKMILRSFSVLSLEQAQKEIFAES